MTEHPDKLDLRSQDISEERKQELLRLFPEIHTEGGKIDFERLKLVIGETVDVGKERYGMNWPGKADCFKTIQAPSMGTLRPCPEESINFDTSENLIIEGDNLEVLKLLQKSYLGKIKMIYIDPPYNTGNDFIYPDNYTESLQTYLQYTGQVDSEGKRFSTNTEADGRFHSKWLNMMYPRLYLARNLLNDDGVIFVSMDDHEIDNLKKLCNEVFGEENHIGTFCWRRRAPSALADKLVSSDHEYVVCYQKTDFISLGTPKEYKGYSNPDNDPRGDWTTGDLTVGMTKDQRPNQFYPLIDPRTGRTYSANPNRVWAYVQESIDKLITDNRIIFSEDTSRRPMVKRFKSDLKSKINPVSTWLNEVGLNSEGTREIQKILGENIAIYPKPKSLITALLNCAASPEDIILDFFAGSGTTAHAVLDLNKKDEGNRKFILVQLPEPTGRKDFPIIAEITKERVRRVIKKLNEEDKKKSPKLFSGEKKKADRGFRVFKLAESNFKTWNADIAKGNVGALEKQLELHIDHIRPERSQEDILYEILLKSGFALTPPIEKLELAGMTIFSAAGGTFMICLERKLTMSVIEAMAKHKPERVVCLDEGFTGNDQIKANAVQIFKTKGVNFKTV
ncbi:MAG: site-specific DNA-methyltransferase [Desulfobacterales bacterium]|nr:site-specific DNA-methyltransferase [Desulfobacterales bacterium]